MPFSKITSSSATRIQKEGFKLKGYPSSDGGAGSPVPLSHKAIKQSR